LFPQLATAKDVEHAEFIKPCSIEDVTARVIGAALTAPSGRGGGALEGAQRGELVRRPGGR
jgi:hypothetical protein